MSATTVYLPGRRTQDAVGAGVEVGRHIEQGGITAGVVIHPGEIDVGRPVILTDAGGSTVLGIVQSPTAIQPPNGAPGTFAHLVVSLETDATPALDAASAVLLGNVAQASHGETVRAEVLGNGDASREFQRVALKKKPLTYVPADGPVPLVSSLQIQVDGIRWHEVPSLYGRGPTERVLVTRIGDDGTAIVQFGDGKTGARVPTGQGNISATYRTGTGLAGRAAAGALTTALDRPRGLKSVTNPVPATGGADPEETADARQNAPRTVRTFGRIVSIRDFEDQVRATGEVAKADARWIWDGLDQAIFLTIAAQKGEILGAEDLRRIASSLGSVRDTNVRLRIANFIRVPVRVVGTVRTDPDLDPKTVVAAAQAAALDALSFDRMGLAQSVNLSDLYAVIQGVDGVLSVDIDVLAFKQPAGMTAAQFDAYLAERAVTRLADGAPAPVQGHLRIFPARPVPPGTLVRPAELATADAAGQDVVLSQATGGSA
jgi:predicted phage baseplate assembly protein